MADNYQLKILVVEDDEGINRLIQKTLRRQGFEVDGVLTGHEAIRFIEEKNDVILLLDFKLADMNAREFVQILQSKSLQVPFIIMTGYGDERIAVEMMKQGAKDYLVKDQNFIELLPQIFSNTLKKLENEKKLKVAEAALQEANELLEQRVTERTAQLAKANENLQREIFEKQQIEEKLIYAIRKSEESNQAKSEFLANVSHELRNPMHHILSYSKYGIDKLNSVPLEKLLHYFRQIKTSGDRLMRLVNDLLDLSKMEAGKMTYSMKKVSMLQILNEGIMEFSQTVDNKRISLSLEECAEEIFLECDMYKIGQVFRNLLSNAVNFSAPGQSITIGYQTTDLNSESGVAVFIQDRGVGIPTEELEAIFDKFTQSSRTKTGAGGTGLGLAICIEIIKDHGGKIFASNNPDGGATFTFVLPLRIKNGNKSIKRHQQIFQTPPA